MREIRSVISLFVHNPENAEAKVSKVVDGNFYGYVKMSCETSSDLKIMFDDPSLAEDLAIKLLEMVSELRKRQGEKVNVQ